MSWGAEAGCVQEEEAGLQEGPSGFWEVCLQMQELGLRMTMGGVGCGRDLLESHQMGVGLPAVHHWVVLKALPGETLGSGPAGM